MGYRYRDIIVDTETGGAFGPRVMQTTGGMKYMQWPFFF
jgi:hypothetical protein